MKIVHIANYSYKGTNGIDVVIDNLIEQSEKYGVNQELIWSITHLKKNKIRRWYNCFSGLRSVFKEKPDFVVIHSIYSVLIPVICLFLKILDVNYSIFPHSSLMYSSLNKSKLKKKIFFKLFLNKIILRAKYVNFLNEEEFINSYSINSAIEIVPNGVKVSKEEEEEEEDKDYKYIAFLGRYDVNHKGIDLLLRSVKNSANIFRANKFQLIMHGVTHSIDDDNYIISYINDNDMNDIVEFNGPILDKEKLSFLNNAKYYVLTSRYEGLPVTVLESLSCNTPVIVTSGTNMMKEVRDNNLGYAIKNSDDDSCLVKDITEALINSIVDDDIYFDYKKYVIENYSWPVIYKSHVENYGKYK